MCGSFSFEIFVILERQICLFGPRIFPFSFFFLFFAYCSLHYRYGLSSTYYVVSSLFRVEFNHWRTCLAALRRSARSGWTDFSLRGFARSCCWGQLTLRTFAFISCPSRERGTGETCSADTLFLIRHPKGMVGYWCSSCILRCRHIIILNFITFTIRVWAEAGTR
jgi:hypothetical protein